MVLFLPLLRFVVCLEVSDVVHRFGHLTLEDIGSFDDVVVQIDLFLQAVEAVLCQLLAGEHSEERACQSAQQSKQRNDNIRQWTHLPVCP